MDVKLPSQSQRRIFPKDQRSECFHNYFLPPDLYPNVVPSSSNSYDLESHSSYVSSPLIREEAFASLERSKLDLERYPKKIGMTYFGRQALFENHYPHINTFQLEGVPTAKQLMFTASEKMNVLVVDHVWLTIYSRKSEYQTPIAKSFKGWTQISLTHY